MLHFWSCWHVSCSVYACLASGMWCGEGEAGEVSVIPAFSRSAGRVVCLREYGCYNPAEAWESGVVEPATVLVLGSYKEHRLNGALAQAGFVPVVRRRMDEALERVKHGRFACIVVERNWVDVDVLEFVLNVRDYDARTRVIVVGNSGDPVTDEALNSLHDTLNVGRVTDPEELTSVLEGVLEEDKQDSCH